MSFFDPVLDAFAGLDDSINEEIPGGWGTVAALTAAAMGAPVPGGVDASAMGSWDVLPAVGEGITAITPETIAATATTAPVVTSQAPIVAQGIPSIPSAGTPIPPAGDPTLTAKGITDTAAQVPITNTPYGTTSADRLAMNSNMGYQGSELPIPTAGNTPTSNPFLDGLGTFGRYVKQGYDLAEEYPKTAIAGAYLGAKGLGLLDPNKVKEEEKYNGPLSRYRMSPNFQPSSAQPNIYRPTYAAAGGIMQAGGPVEQMSNNAMMGVNTMYPMANIDTSSYTGARQGMASGGIAHFRKGNLADSLDFYKNMTESRGGKGASAPKGEADVGIYYDLDPDTRYQDALTAAQIRQAKINKRSNVTAPVAKRPTPMGQLNLRPPGAQAAAASSSLDPEMAAQGGIMHSSLGGYAAGGNPRLLKGPGDGMSDNIPATIANKQPARLADGEFVIPADVVSHLGNGSTDAGARKLHEMMSKVRKARTGNPKQGKQINPRKYMPA